MMPLDQELGTGGWPAGRIVELFGDGLEAKRLLVWHALASAQRMGGGAVLLCPEGQVSPETAAETPVDFRRLVIIHPDDGSEALAAACDLADAGTMVALAICGFQIGSQQDSALLLRLFASARRTGTLVLICSPPWRSPTEAPNAASALLRRHADVRVCVLAAQQKPARPCSVELEIVTNRAGGRRGRLTVSIPPFRS